MLQTILTELKGGDNAKISQALSAGVKKSAKILRKSVWQKMSLMVLLKMSQESK